MIKNVTLGWDGRDLMKKGVDEVANAVKVTMGPSGRLVVIGKQLGSPQITKDGVTVAREVEPAGVIENIGATMIKEVASKTVDLGGDGTTCSVVLAQEIITQGIQLIGDGLSPIDVRAGIDKATRATVEQIKELSRPVEDKETLVRIATIASNNDVEIGKLIADAFDKVGKDGIITVEESFDSKTSIKVVEGMRLDRGWIRSELINNEEKARCEMEDAYVLICNKQILAMGEMVPLLEKCAQAKKPLLIIAESVEGEALATVVVNKLKGIVSVCVIGMPFFGERRQAAMEDIAVATGGMYLTEASGISLDKVDFSMLGRADRIVVEKGVTTIIGGKGQKKDAHIANLYAQIASISAPQKEFLEERIARLKGGIAIMSIGGYSKTEVKEKADRIDDAIRATKAAYEEGFVAGGGSTFLHCLQKVEQQSQINSNPGELAGISIVFEAIKKPFQQILLNGGVEPSNPMHDVCKAEYGTGYNMRTGKVENLLESGVIDPAKVLRVALENASSIASMFLITECVISDIKNPKA